MQIIKIERNSHDIFCPITGLPVADQMGEPVAPTARGIWVGEVMDQPFIWDEELQRCWDEYLDERFAEDDEEPIDAGAFLASLDAPGWVAFEITVCGFACGPVWSTSWTVLDLTDHSDGDEAEEEETAAVRRNGR